jgi:hypothetical protein
VLCNVLSVFLCACCTDLRWTLGAHPDVYVVPRVAASGAEKSPAYTSGKLHHPCGDGLTV